MRLLITPPHTSWTHRLCRVLVRPLVGTPVTPNHLTLARLVSGVAACAAFSAGDGTWMLWGGVLWLISCLLDRADGELARLGGLSSPWGHQFDYYCDVAVNGLFFLAIGVGLRNGEYGAWTIAMGAIAGTSVAAASVLSERLEQVSGSGAKAYAGILGFDFDDILYLLGPAGWFGLFPAILIGASICAPLIVALTGARLLRMRPGHGT